MKRLERRFPDGRDSSVGGSILLPDGHRPGETPVLVLAHGAGAGMDHPFMVTMQRSLAERGVAVVLFNFGYKDRGNRAPDRGPVLEECYRAVAGRVREDDALSPTCLVLGGKSMGGRIGSQIVAAGFSAEGLLFLGYPLHPAGKPERLRREHLGRINVPTLFVQGTRDALCDLELLRGVLPDLPGPVTLHEIEGGDHSFKVLKRSGRVEAEVFAELADVCTSWLRDLEERTQ